MESKNVVLTVKEWEVVKDALEAQQNECCPSGETMMEIAEILERVERDRKGRVMIENKRSEWCRIERSRNEGQFWSKLIVWDYVSEDEALRCVANEHRDHPSDWLRIVKVEETVVKEIFGNKKSK